MCEKYGMTKEVQVAAGGSTYMVADDSVKTIIPTFLFFNDTDKSVEISTATTPLDGMFETYPLIERAVIQKIRNDPQISCVIFVCEAAMSEFSQYEGETPQERQERIEELLSHARWDSDIETKDVVLINAEYRDGRRLSFFGEITTDESGSRSLGEFEQTGAPDGGRYIQIFYKAAQEEGIAN